MRDNYPMMSQSEERNAPWNQDSLKPTKVSVCISITLSKTVEVMVDDYKVEKNIDEDGNLDIQYDFSDCDLKKAVEEQITLPHQAFEELYGTVYLSEDRKSERVIEDLRGWTVDDFEVVEE